MKLEEAMEKFIRNLVLKERESWLVKRHQELIRDVVRNK
jgi:hypothetical protein